MHMPDVLLPVLFGHRFSYVKRRCSKPVQVIAEGRSIVAISEVAPEEAPMVFRVVPLERPSYDIRAFGGRHWWPARWMGDILLTKRVFADALGRGIGYGLDLLAPRMLAVYGGPAYPTKAQICDSAILRSVDAEDEERLARYAQATAGDLMFCGGVLYIAGGPPVICVQEGQGDSMATMYVADSTAHQVGPKHIGRSAGDAENVRRLSMTGLVYGPHERHEANEAADRFGADPISRDDLLILQDGGTYQGAHDYRLSAVYLEMVSYLKSDELTAKFIAHEFDGFFEGFSTSASQYPEDHAALCSASVAAFIRVVEATNHFSSIMDQIYLLAKNHMRAQARRIVTEFEGPKCELDPLEEYALVAAFAAAPGPNAQGMNGG